MDGHQYRNNAVTHDGMMKTAIELSSQRGSAIAVLRWFQAMAIKIY